MPFDLASDDNIGTSGLLMPSIEARLADEDGQDVAEGEAGELWVRGPNVMKVCSHRWQEVCVALTLGVLGLPQQSHSYRKYRNTRRLVENGRCGHQRPQRVLFNRRPPQGVDQVQGTLSCSKIQFNVAHTFDVRDFKVCHKGLALRTLQRFILPLSTPSGAREHSVRSP